jgi:restriction system protein
MDDEHKEWVSALFCEYIETEQGKAALMDGEIMASLLESGKRYVLPIDDHRSIIVSPDDLTDAANNKLFDELMLLFRDMSNPELSAFKRIDGLLDVLKEMAWPNSKTFSPLSVESVVIPKTKTAEGLLIESVSVAWGAIAKRVLGNWSEASSIPPRVWEEIVAGAYKKHGFDEVVLTPRSNDHGRDIIATKYGLGSIRILGSVKAYRPGHLITKEEVHALMGVLALDPNASKGLFTTTSDFAPRLLDDPRLALAVPHRIELMNGEKLRAWLKSLVDRDK